MNVSQNNDDLEMDVSELPCTMLTLRHEQERHERAGKIVTDVWRTIPVPERVRILKDVSQWDNPQVIMLILDDWKHTYGTNARIFLPGECAVIDIDGGYFDAAEDYNVMTTIAHELGHLRGLCDGDSSEETAARYQSQWGFPNGQVIFKDEACRYIDSVLSKEGIPGEVFWFPGSYEYYYLRGGTQLRLRGSSICPMYDQPWATLKGLLLGYWPEDFPEIAEREASADELKSTERFAEYQRELTRITEECLPEDMW